MKNFERLFLVFSTNKVSRNSREESEIRKGKSIIEDQDLEEHEVGRNHPIYGIHVE